MTAPRTESGPYFDAEAARLLTEARERGLAYLAAERAVGRCDLSVAQGETLVGRLLRDAHDQYVEALRQGRRAGRAGLLAEWGLPAEHLLGPDDITKRLAPCPLNRQPCTVPAALTRKAPDGQ